MTGMKARFSSSALLDLFHRFMGRPFGVLELTLAAALLAEVASIQQLDLDLFER
jgi:hypothetical protein